MIASIMSCRSESDDARGNVGVVPDRPMVRVVVAARTNRVSARLPVIVSDNLIGYLLGGDGRRPPCRQPVLCGIKSFADMGPRWPS